MDDNADAMSITDISQKVLRWNSAAEKLYGYTEAEMLGHSIICLIPEDYLDDLDVGKNVRTNGNEAAFDTYRIRKDGKRIRVGLSISPVKDELGQVIACCAIHKI